MISNLKLLRFCNWFPSKIDEKDKKLYATSELEFMGLYQNQQPIHIALHPNYDEGTDKHYVLMLDYKTVPATQATGPVS